MTPPVSAPRNGCRAASSTASTVTRAANGSTSSWRFAKVATTGKVLFKSAKNELAVAQAAGLTNISVDRADDTGVNGGNGSYGIYRIALDQ